MTDQLVACNHVDNISRKDVAATKTHPEIPCEVCGYPRIFLADLQWCGNCGWNRETALSGLRLRSRIMIGVAAFIAVGEAFLLLAIPMMGEIYLPLFVILAAAIAIIPYREYRSVQRIPAVADNSATLQAVATKLPRLKPHLRMSALLLLGIASATDIGLFVALGTWLDRILPASILLIAIVFFGSQFLKERRIAVSYAPTWAKILRFERQKRGRSAVYQYESLAGISITGKGGSLWGFSVGMSVPLLYRTSNPEESLAVPDFLFYAVRAEQP